MASGPLTSWQIEGENVEAVTDLLLVSKITADGDCSHEIRRWLLLGRKATTNLDNALKSRDITLLTKVHIVKATVFPGVTYGCESWTIDKFCRTQKNWCLGTVALEKTPEGPLDSKEIKPVNLKGNQSWILIERTDTEAKAVVFWSSDVNSLLIGKVPDTEKDWGQKGKRASKDKMAGLHHLCNGPELGQTSGDGEGQGDLAYCSPWDHKELDTTRWLNNNWLTGAYVLGWCQLLLVFISPLITA